MLLGTDFEKGLTSSAALMRGAQTDNAAREIRELLYPFTVFFKNIGELLGDFSVLLLVISAALCEFFSHFGAGALAISAGFIIVCALLRTVLRLIYEHSLSEHLTDDGIKVLRDGKIKAVKGTSLVRGDVVILTKGDIVPRDMRLVESDNLCVIEKYGGRRIKPVAKDAMHFPLPEGSMQLRHKKNMVYAGSAVTSGEALAVVVDERMTIEQARRLVTINEDAVQFYIEKQTVRGTGIRLARKSAFTGNTPVENGYSEDNCFSAALSRTASVMRICSLCVGTLVFLLGVFARVPLSDAFLFGVVLMASAPAALYELCTGVSFALAALRLRAQKVRIGSFESAEKLVLSRSILCCGGTGYSIDKMYMEAAYVGRSMDFSKENARNISKLTQLLLFVSELCLKSDKGTARSLQGDKEALAVLEGARKIGVVSEGAERLYTERLAEFHDINGSLTASHVLFGGRRILVTKGNVASLLGKCSHYDTDTGAVPLDAVMSERIMSNAKSYENNESCRVVAVAYKACDYVKRSDLRQGFIFAGFAVLGTRVNYEGARYVEILRKYGITPVLFSNVSSDMVLSDARKMGYLSATDNYITSKSFSSLDENIYSEDLGTYTLYMGFGSLQKRAVVRNKKHIEDIVTVAADAPGDAFDMSEADVLMSFGKEAPKTLRKISDIHSRDTGIGVIYRTVCICRNMLRCTALSAGYLICAQAGAAVLGLLGIISAFFTGGALPLGISQLCALTLVCDLVISVLTAVIRTPSSIISDSPGAFYEYFRLRRIIPMAAFSGVACGCVSFLAFLFGVFLSKSGAVGTACAFTVFFLSKCFVSLFCIMTQSTARAPAYFPVFAAVAEAVLGAVLAAAFGTAVLPFGYGVGIPVLCLVLSVLPAVFTKLYQRLEGTK